MNLTTLDQRTMESMKILSETNVEIGKAKGILADLQATEATYLEEREKKAVERIDNLLTQSEDILARIGLNYDEVRQFANDVTTYVGFLKELQQKVLVAIESFNQKADTFDQYVAQEEARLAEIKKDLEVREKQMVIDKQSVADGLKRIKEGKLLINSRQQQITEALMVLDRKKQQHG